MANGDIDHVAAGIAALPEKLRRARIARYLSVYLRQFDSLESVVEAVINAFINWQVPGEQLDFVLDAIGSLVGQPRPDGYDNERYAFILQARVLVRQSEATLPDVYRVANFLAQGKTVRVFGFPPKVIIVVFVDLVLDAEQQALYRQLLLDTIGAVDRLVVQHVTSATAFYDFGEYDEELYAP